MEFLNLLTGICTLGDESTSSTMQTGLYFYDTSGVVSNRKLAYNLQTKSTNSLPLTHYDPSKPTLIYVHGWQQNSMPENFEIDFKARFLDNLNFAPAWKNPNATVYGTDYTSVPLGSGKNPGTNSISYGTDIYTYRNHTNKSTQAWNIAIFDWVEYADENEVKDAEAKIWKVSNGRKNMRKRLSDGSYVDNSELAQLNLSVGQAIAESLCEFFKGYGKELRLMGHSLGGQTITRVAKLISDMKLSGSYPTSPMPARLEHCDPFWSNGGKDYLGGRWNGELCSEYAEELWSRYKTAMAQYRTSPTTSTIFVGDANTRFNNTVVLMNISFWWTGDLRAKHVTAPEWYMSTIAHGQTVECYLNWWNGRRTTGKVSAGAACSTERMREMMRESKHWTQVEGRYEKNSSSHWFEKKNGNNGNLAS